MKLLGYISLLFFFALFFEQPLQGQLWQRKIATGEVDIEPRLQPIKGGYAFESGVGEIILRENDRERGSFTIEIPQYAQLAREDEPLLPQYSILFEAGTIGTAELVIEAMDSVIIQLDPEYRDLELARASESRKSIEPGFDLAAGQVSPWLGREAVRAGYEGKLRGLSLGSLTFCPVQFNPSAGQIKVYTRIRGRVLTGRRAATHEIGNRAFGTIYDRIVGAESTGSRKSASIDLPQSYIILSDTLFRKTLQPFIRWKKRKGFKVLELYVQDISGERNSDSIKSALLDMYLHPLPGTESPSYLLIAGNEEHVPPSPSESEVTDLYYAEYDEEGDYMPELFYGRISVDDSAQLSGILNKIIKYEQYDFQDPSFLDQTVLIAGVDDKYAPVYGNGQVDFLQDSCLNTLSGHVVKAYIHPGSGARREEIIADISAGAGFVNYTGHGEAGGWLNPDFSTNDAFSLNNHGKYSWFVGNGCKTNLFTGGLCLAEALLRADDRGAVGYIGCTNDAYWSEDYLWARGCFGSFYRSGVEETDWPVSTLGAMLFAGNMAVQESGSSRKKFYWEIYQLAGDPSLIPWTGQARIQDPIVPSVLPLPGGTLSVFCAPGSLLALSGNNELLAVAKGDGAGLAELHVPDTVSGPLDLLITARGYIPFVTRMEASNPQGPFPGIAGWSLIEESEINDGYLNPGESCSLDLLVFNYGNEPILGDTLFLRDPGNKGTIIRDSIAIIDKLVPGDSLEIQKAFSLKVSTDMKDQEQLVLSVEHKGEGQKGFIRERIYAPVLKSGRIRWDDRPHGNGNGIAEAGERIRFRWSMENSGHAMTGKLKLISASAGGRNLVNPVSPEIPGIPGPGDTVLEFIAGLPPTDLNMYDSLEFICGDGTMETKGNLLLHYNRYLEDFGETLSVFPFETTRSYPWNLDPSPAEPGNGCLRSGRIPDRRQSDLSIAFESEEPDSISFRLRISSEKNYDFLECILDDSVAGRWSGQQDWFRISLPLEAGYHKLTWSYSKDRSLSEGEDAAWIDDIVFPSGAFMKHDLALMDIMCAGSWQSGIVTNSILVRNTSEEIVAGFKVDVFVDSVHLCDTLHPAPLAPGEEVWLHLERAMETIPGKQYTVEAIVTSERDSYPGNNRIRKELAFIFTSDSENREQQEGGDDFRLHIYPNPTSGILQIEYKQLKEGSEIQVIDMKGRILDSFELKGSNGNHAISLDWLEAGIYYMRLKGAPRASRIVLTD